MTTEADTKLCPFCAEEIKAAAIKCRWCGEMLDGSGGRPSGEAPRAIHETQEFFVPLPEDALPCNLAFEKNYDRKIKRKLVEQLWLEAPDGEIDGDKYDLSYDRWTKEVWLAWKPYFLQRVNELGSQGWQLTEPFESITDRGSAVIPEKRMCLEEVPAQGLFGPKKAFIVIGANFIMRRTRYE